MTLDWYVVSAVSVIPLNNNVTVDERQSMGESQSVSFHFIYIQLHQPSPASSIITTYQWFLCKVLKGKRGVHVSYVNLVIPSQC